MKLLLCSPIKVLIIVFLLLQLFSLECLADVSAPDVVVSQESKTLQNISAEEKVGDLSRIMREQRVKSGFLDIGITALIALYPIVFERERGLEVAIKYLFIWGPIFWIVAYSYGQSGIYYLSRETPIEKDFHKLNLIIDSGKREEKAVFMLKNNQVELHKERGKYSLYKAYLFSPGLNKNIVEESLKEYFNQNQAKTDLNEYVKREYGLADLETKTKWLWEWGLTEFNESAKNNLKEDENMTIYEGWALGLDMDTSKANVGDYIYPCIECGIYDGSEPNAKKMIDLSIDDKCLVVDQKNETNYRFIFNYKNGLWYKIRVVK